jgi:hypothetical protein
MSITNLKLRLIQRACNLCNNKDYHQFEATFDTLCSNNDYHQFEAQISLDSHIFTSPLYVEDSSNWNTLFLRARLQTSNAIYSRKRPALASNSQFKVFFDLRRLVTKLAIILHQIKVSRPFSKLKSKLFSFFLFCFFCF